MEKDFSLCPATRADAPTIRAMIREARNNPLGLDWRRFVLAVTPQGEVIGCGQIKPHGDGSRELASITVVPGWQRRGVARRLIERLLAAQPGPLYLTCRAQLGPFYEKFGFYVLKPAEMPPYFRRLARLAHALGAVRLMPEEMLVMKREVAVNRDPAEPGAGA